MLNEIIHTTCMKCGAKGMRIQYHHYADFYVPCIRYQFCLKCDWSCQHGIATVSSMLIRENFKIEDEQDAKFDKWLGEVTDLVASGSTSED